MAIPTAPPLRFGLFEFNPATGDLRRRGLSVRLTPQARTLLCMLVEAPDKIHSRDEIQRRLWPGNTFVDFEHGVNKVAHSLREALGESARNPRFIETVATEGYRFLSNALEQGPAKNQHNATSAIERLAVLPLSTDGEVELRSMCRMITWYLTDRLAVIPGLRVMAESTVKCKQLENLNPQQVGERLGVEAILVGELTRQDGYLILQFELIDAVDGALLGGALVERAWQPGVRCEKDLALDVFRRIRPFFGPVSVPRKPPQQVLLPESNEKAS